MSAHPLPPGPAEEVDVAIVGYGPTGAVLANLLGAQGWRVAVLDREPDLLDLPRAVHFDAEVMRIFQAAGAAQALLPHIRPSLGMQYLNVAGQLMLERKPAAGAGPQGWANNYLFHQPDLERALRAGAQRHAGVRTWLSHEVVSVSQDAAGATVQARDLATGAQRQWQAQWVVGCDGARSLVRETLGVTQEDLGLHQSWLVVDLVLERELELPVATVQFCDPARPMTYVNVTGRRRRWEIMLMPGDDPQALMQPERLWAMLSRWLKPDDATVVRQAVYTFHALIARRWREARLLLAGDSAHQTPPFLGQGMCAGVRDASNLAWKLDLVLRGSDASLLDTYQSERAPHVREYIETAVRLGNIIQTTDPQVAAQRDRQFAQGGTQEIVNLSPRLGPGCHVGAAPAGTLPGQPRLSDGRLLDEALQTGFALVSADDALGAQLTASEKAPLQELTDPALAPWLDALGARALLLRPDRHVFATVQSAEELRARLQDLQALAPRMNTHR
jgi:3-(3-hydroxy-phenyl)propionate hydroxylase